MQNIYYLSLLCSKLLLLERLAGSSVEHAAFDFGVVSLSPTLGIEVT